MRLSEKIQKDYATPYQKIAKKHGVSVQYVTKIANGHRIPTKKKGLAVLEDLQKLAEN